MTLVSSHEGAAGNKKYNLFINFESTFSGISLRHELCPGKTILCSHGYYYSTRDVYKDDQCI